MNIVMRVIREYRNVLHRRVGLLAEAVAVAGGSRGEDDPGIGEELLDDTGCFERSGIE